ncbi:MerR family transcriptional regulator [Bradyrhizobium sp. STM 3557]|uniref:MerR family transcriptional regulator n=1 Tax=Bradyrhizobium sp. STM 3557 TaxID=578920 RepID=UPI00388D14DC
MKPLRIGALARQTGTNAPTIRYYEEIGLLPSAGRQAGNQRVYGEADVRSLTFIRRCREFGFSIEQVRSLLALVQNPASSCTGARDLAKAHLTTVRSKLAELKALERSIAGFVTSCDATCVGGAAPDCVILGDLSNGCGKPGPAQRRSRAEPQRPKLSRAV